MKLYYDLHLHSCLSPCGDDEMTPANLAAMCKLAGLEVVALTDHNSTGNSAAFQSAAEARGLLAVPGMELCTREEIHVVCLFPGLAEAEGFGAFVRGKLPDIPNRVRVFGRQLYMDSEDGILGEEPVLLAGAADIGVDQVSALVRQYGGVAYPAHVDRPSFSLLPCLGAWDPGLGFPLAERSSHCPPDFWACNPSLSGVSSITGSDAHYLDQVLGACHTIELPERSARAVIRWISAGGTVGNQ